MRDLIAITISDVSGARHFTIKKSVKHYLTIGATAAVVIALASVSYNFLQFQRAASLTEHNQWLDADNVRLTNRLAVQNLQVRGMHHVIGEIEKLAGVETGDNRTALKHRIQALGRFYTAKEDEYEDVVDRLGQIEEMLNPDVGYVWDDEQRELELLARATKAAVSVQQETILRNNIPNGYPIRKNKITSEYGYRIHPVTKKKSFHRGIDIRGKHEEVFATADGIVRIASVSRRSGKHVLVRHNFGFETMYTHLNKINVKPGDIIHKGAVLGISGDTGTHATGPHLHYETHYLGEHIDPSNFLDWEFGSDEIFSQVTQVKWQSLINLINKQIANPTLQLSQLDVVSPEK